MAILVSRARRDTPSCTKVLHFNNAGASLPPQTVIDVVTEHQRQEWEFGGYEAADAAADRYDAIYTSIAQLLNAQPGEIALVESATVGWNIAFQGITWKAGDRVLTSRAEYESNYLAFLHFVQRFGIEVTPVPDDAHGQLDVDALRAMLDDRVKLIAVTHVPTNGGLVNPAAAIGALSRQNGILYLLDACQSVGQLNIDVEAIGCDLLSFAGRKFMRAPRGTGALYVRTGVMDRIDPLLLDGRSATWVAPDRYEMRDDAKRFETFECNVAARLGLGAAADYALGWGIDAIAQRVKLTANNLRTQLADISGLRVRDMGSEKCGIVTFTIDGLEAEQVKSTLAEEKVKVNVSVTTRHSTLLDMDARGLHSMVRASVHYYNSDDEVDRFCGLIRRITAHSY